MYGIIKLAISKDNKNIYTCNYYSEVEKTAVSVLSLDSASGKISYVNSVFNNDSNVYGSLYFIDITCSYDNKNVYAITDGDIIKIYSRNLTSGKLTFLSDFQLMDPNSGSSYFEHTIIISKDDKYIYIIGDEDILILSRNINTGNLTWSKIISCYDDISNASLYFIDAKLSDDQSSLFITNMDAPYLIQYKRDSNTGLLSFVNTYITFNDLNGPYSPEPRSVCVSNDNNYVYLGLTNFSIAIAKFNPQTDNYDYYNTVYAVPQSINGTFSALQFTPDNRNLYAVSFDDQSVTNYEPSYF